MRILPEVRSGTPFWWGARELSGEWAPVGGCGQVARVWGPRQVDARRNSTEKALEEVAGVLLSLKAGLMTHIRQIKVLDWLRCRSAHCVG